MSGRCDFFPSVDQVLDLLEAKAEQSYHDREAERTQGLLREAREIRAYRESHPEEAAASDANVKDLAKRMKSMPHIVREPVRSPRNVLALSQSKVLRSVVNDKGYESYFSTRRRP